MKHKVLITSLLLGASLSFVGMLRAEQVTVTGNYTTAGEIHGDLVVVNGSVNIASGDLSIDGDLKVMGGFVLLSAGTLRVGGDLIVRNEGAFASASVSVTGDLEVTGAIITKSVAHHAHVIVLDPGGGTTGSLKAGRISTYGANDAFISVAHFITVVGPIITRSSGGNAHVISQGASSVFGDIYAGSIFTNSNSGIAYVRATSGHITVNGQIITNGSAASDVSCEGNLKAGSIFTKSTNLAAYVSGESIDVRGDIRTNAPGSDAYVRSIFAGAVHGDIVANNIYTKGDDTVYVKADRNIDVKGDIVTWEISGGPSAYVLSGVSDSNGSIKSQNIITNGVDDAYVSAQTGIDVKGDIITKSVNGEAYVLTVTGDLKAGNIVTHALSSAKNAYVHNSNGNIDVTHVISTKQTNQTRSGYPEMMRNGFNDLDVLATSGDIRAEKIFTTGVGDASVRASSGGAPGEIIVKGPIVTNSTGDDAQVQARDLVKAGAIKTSGTIDASVVSLNDSIVVVEDIRTESSGQPAYVQALSGNITARSIKTKAAGAHFDDSDSIKAAPGSARFQWAPKGQDDLIEIKNAIFDFDSDHSWSSDVKIEGTCTINGRGHHLDFGPGGSIIVTAGATLLLRNITLDNISAGSFVLASTTSTLIIDNVVWRQNDDFDFDSGQFEARGDWHMHGPGKEFRYSSSEQSEIKKNARIVVHHGFRFKYDTGDDVEIAMEDETSRLEFDDGILHAVEDFTITKGTLRFDNTVSFSVEDTKTISIGDGTPANNVVLEFGRATQLVFRDLGSVVNLNV